MNFYLDEATKVDLKARMLRFDDDLTGKAVAKSIYSGETVAMAFADGTWVAVHAVDESDGEPSVHHLGFYKNANLYDLRDLGLITEEQFTVAEAKEKEARLGYKLKEVERLKAEIERGR